MTNNVVNELFPETLQILKDLISFKTISGENNLEFVDYCEKKLASLGARSIKTYNKEQIQANLFSTIGDDNDNGIILSGHSDVVPANSRNWTSDPFIARDEDKKIFGRGTSDMKGFIA